MLALEITVLVLLTVVNGVFSMSELAVVSSRRARLQHMAEGGRRGARTALRLIEQPSRFLSTVQIGITMVGIVAGAYGGATLGDRLGRWLATLPVLAAYGHTLGVGAVLVGITYLSIVIGELIPKRVALKNPEGIAAAVARPMDLLSRLVGPFVWLLGASTDALLRLLGLHGERSATVTEEEVRSMITEGTRAGVFAPQEKEMIDGVLRLADRSVRSIMTPRRDVVWLDAAADAAAAIERIRSAGHSRYPVCRGVLDELIGVLHSHTLLESAVMGRPFDLLGGALAPLTVHDGTPVLRLLDLMKKTGHHLAVVVDEYGSVEGIATLTDIVSTIAGELPEDGREAERPAVRRDANSWLVEGWMPIEEFEDAIGRRGLRGDGDFHTVAGLVLHGLGHLPQTGAIFESRGVRYEVVDMDGRRIDKILVTVPPNETWE